MLFDNIHTIKIIIFVNPGSQQLMSEHIVIYVIASPRNKACVPMNFRKSKLVLTGAIMDNITTGSVPIINIKINMVNEVDIIFVNRKSALVIGLLNTVLIQ